ncbi:MAG: hypothetical protein M1814_000773 [Vezdaea aestivalis]|nr:MAG: hypothetical protein M1814_000773 [Vezdaea aestivalis]
MSSQLLSYAGWVFLPNLVTGWVQTIYYGIMIRAGDPKPPPGSPKYRKHRQRIYFFVITLYLLYTIFEADWEIRRAGDFYQDLGVAPDADERAIKSKFNRLAALHHPDKVNTARDTSAASNYFVQLKLAREILTNPTKRFAYDRFGPSMLDWQHCASVLDYVVAGLQQLAPYYVAGGVFMVLLSLLGYIEWGAYWRFLAFGTLMIFEGHTITRPYFPAVTTKFINHFFAIFTAHPPYLPFQTLTLARKLVLTLFIAFSRLGPLLEDQDQKGPQKSEAQLDQQLDHLEHIAQGTEFEATRLLTLEMAPFAGDEKALKDVQVKSQEWLVQNTIRGAPEVRDAVGRVMNRRRAGAPTGARGTK